MLRLTAFCQINQPIPRSFNYQQDIGTFVGLDRGRQPLPGLPPDNCEICLKLSEQDTNNHGRLIKANGVTIGVSFRGHVYHVHDFARVKADSGLCHVGQIQDIYFKKHVCKVELRLLGRISDIREVCPHELKDEVCAQSMDEALLICPVSDISF